MKQGRDRVHTGIQLGLILKTENLCENLMKAIARFPVNVRKSHICWCSLL